MEAKDRIAALEAELKERDQRISELEKQVCRLEELQGQNSGNSNRAPSSDTPQQRRQRRNKRKKKQQKGRKRGGQKGHKGSFRQLVAVELVDDVVDLFPPECESCWHALPQVADPWAKRHQLTDLKGYKAHLTEYRRHRVVCPACGHKTRRKYDKKDIPLTAFGPRLMAVVVLLTGAYHLSREKTAQLLLELLGVRISTGSVSAIEKRMTTAVEPAVEEAQEAVAAAKVKHADGTAWYQSRTLLSLWTVASAAVTIFKILPDGRRDTLRTQLFTNPRGILVSDRASALKYWEMRWRQICWSHLLRKFVSFSERDGPIGKRIATFGKQLVEYAKVVFAYWHEFRDDKLTRAQLRESMAPVRKHFEVLLRRAEVAKLPGLLGSCRDILAHREALWTFIEHKGVEPTNNHAERQLRGFVLWRKRSFGAQSERGHRFAERIMTVAHTARKQGRKLLEFLTGCATAWLTKTTPPRLLAPIGLLCR